MRIAFTWLGRGEHQKTKLIKSKYKFTLFVSVVEKVKQTLFLRRTRTQNLGFNFFPSLRCCILRYDGYLCLVISNKQQINVLHVKELVRKLGNGNHETGSNIRLNCRKPRSFV